MMQTRSAIAFIVTVLFTAQSVHAQAGEAGDAMHQRIAALPANAHVAVALADGSTARGRIGNRNDQDFVLNPDNGSAARTIAYAQVTTVEQIKAHHSAKKTWIIFGVVVVATLGIIVGVVATHLKY